MCVVAAAMPTAAQVTHVQDGVTYTLSGSTATVTAVGDDVTPDLTILSPVTVDDTSYAVAIGAADATISLFADKGLTGLTLKGEFESMGPYAFSGCTSLQSVDMSGITGDLQIGSYSFSGCTALASVALPPSATAIGDYAFSDCTGLTAIEIPAGVVSLSNQLSGCNKLTSLTFAEDSQLSICRLGESNGVGVKRLSLPDKVTEVYFLRVGIQTIDLSLCTNLKSIGDQAFRYCYELAEIMLPEGLESIGNYCFASCLKLTSITIPATVTSMGTNMFNGCSAMITAVLPPEITTLPNNIFYNCSALTSLGDNDGSTWVTVGANAFYGCSKFAGPLVLTNCERILGNAFKGAKMLKDITMGDKVTIINDNAFNGSPITSISLSQSLTSIGKSAFYNCDGLTEISIPAAVQSIDESAFADCDNLKIVKLFATPVQSRAAKTFGNKAFAGTTTLDHIYTVNAEPPTITPTGTNATFTEATYNNAQLHMLEGSKAAYAAASGWSRFVNMDDDSLTGVEEIDADGSEETVEVFTPSGVRVYSGPRGDMPALNGLYIVRSGAKVGKVIY